MADPTVKPRGELIGNFVFAGMDRVVHLAPGFGLGLSMSSSRVFTYESIHGENVNGWHTGEGMLYLYNSDLTQFDDDFWPTVDPRRLPGTTVDVSQIREPASGQSEAPATTWVGGASLGAYGAAGMQLRAWGSTLTAKKSWFMFDREVVCLGSDICSGDSRPIETVVENRLLHGGGDQTLTVDGARKTGALGWSEPMRDVTWAHLAGQTEVRISAIFSRRPSCCMDCERQDRAFGTKPRRPYPVTILHSGFPTERIQPEQRIRMCCCPDTARRRSPTMPSTREWRYWQIPIESRQCAWTRLA